MAEHEIYGRTNFLVPLYFAWNNRKHLQQGTFSDGGLNFLLALGADRRSVLPDVSDKKILQRLEKAEFFIVDLYFYGSGCYPLGRGRVQGLTRDRRLLIMALINGNLYPGDRTGFTKNKRKRVEKNADKQGSWARIRFNES
jgi:hypothetical protein